MILHWNLTCMETLAFVKQVTSIFISKLTLVICFRQYLKKSLHPNEFVIGWLVGLKLHICNNNQLDKGQSDVCQQSLLSIFLLDTIYCKDEIKTTCAHESNICLTIDHRDWLIDSADLAVTWVFLPHSQKGESWQ